MPAEAFFVLGAISQYIGAAWAVKTFDDLDPRAVAWLRRVRRDHPVAAPVSGPAWTDLGLLGVIALVGLLSNVMPYGLDQVVMRRLSPSRSPCCSRCSR